MGRPNSVMTRDSTPRLTASVRADTTGDGTTPSCVIHFADSTEPTGTALCAIIDSLFDKPIPQTITTPMVSSSS